MRNYIFLFVFFVNTTKSFCQDYEFAIIQDKDGFTNVRFEPSTKSKIIGTLKNNDVFFAMQEVGKEDWYEVGRPNLKGFVHKSRIKLFSSFSKIDVLVERENYLKFNGQNVSLEIVIDKFNLLTNSVLKSADGKVVEKINGKKFYGTDGDLPKKSFKSITCKINNQEIRVPQEQLNDIFEPNLRNADVYFDMKSETVYVSMYNSDGAGGYHLGFIFRKKEVPKRYIFNDF
jgi:hypothetical protein